ncbi:MAG TPA: L,D-transpeptidase family protein [Gammaproteobacteria bacterium]|nr:L,D-transpeptidase family protein [Gammaproteobacteria bacterium]
MAKVSARLRTAALALGIGLLAGQEAAARVYTLHGDVLGELALTTTVREDTLADIARTYSQGYKEMRLANPQVDPWLTGEDTEIVIPSQYVLPDAPRTGIVINVAEMRIYHFQPPRKGQPQEVATYPISIGRQDWATPHGATKVVSKVKDPTWTPPASIRREHAAEGDILPAVVPAGPNNPLGRYALRLGFNGYLIHGTDKPFGIGMRVTHGCMRLYPEDIERVFHSVPVGTTVRIVNQPYKLGVLGQQLLLEVHPALEEDVASGKFAAEFSHVMAKIVPLSTTHDIGLDWAALRGAIYRKDGVPVVIGTLTPRAAAASSPRTLAARQP